MSRYFDKRKSRRHASRHGGLSCRIGSLRRRKSYYILPIGRHSCQSRKVSSPSHRTRRNGDPDWSPGSSSSKQGPIKGRTGEYGQMNVREGKCISHIHGNLQRVIPTFIMKRHPMYILIRIISATLVYERHLRTKRPFFYSYSKEYPPNPLC